MSFFTKIKDKTHRTLIAGPGDKLKIIEKLKLDEKSRPQNLEPLIFLKISEEYENQ